MDMVHLTLENQVHQGECYRCPWTCYRRKFAAGKTPPWQGWIQSWTISRRYLKDEAFAKYGKTLKGAAEAYRLFCRGLIDALYEVVPAVKPQSAYFEVLGSEGIAALEDVVAYAKEKDLYVIMDAKRGDIGSTCEAYAQAYLGGISIDGADRPFRPSTATALPSTAIWAPTASVPLPSCAGRTTRPFSCW